MERLGDLTRAASHCAGLLLRLAWFAAIVGANLHAEEAPSITSAQGNAPGWITIGYEHSGSDGVLGFALEADKRGIVQTQGAPVGQFFDTSLSPNSKHSYRVCAIYEESQLECSAWVQAQTLPAPAPPSNFNPPIISNFHATPTSIAIAWGATGTYSKIMVGWSKVGSARAQPFVENRPNWSYTVENLEPATLYTFALKGCAMNVLNTSCGPWSPRVDILTPLPDAAWVNPQLRISEHSNTKVVLQFSAIAMHSRGRDIFRIFRNGTPIHQLKPEGPANFGARTGTFTDLTEARHTYNVCITDDDSEQRQVCTNSVIRPRILRPPPAERVISKGPSPATSCVDIAGGCEVKAPPHPDTCKSGFVWREAFSGDTVCVTPQVRAQAAVDNSQAANRRVPNGGATCMSGFVWREARAGDLVCVTPETRTQAGIDNRQGNERRLVPRYKRLFRR